MKKKKILCNLIIYLFVLNVLPLNFLTRYVDAEKVQGTYRHYDNSNTWTENK